MKISDAFPSKWLKASDLRGRSIVLKMDRIELEKLDKETKPVVYFVGKEKGLVLNKTNSNRIAEAYGDDTDDWQDQFIELYPTEVEFQGDTVEAIRVRVPKKQSSNGAERQQARPKQEPISERNPPAADLDGDEIPF